MVSKVQNLRFLQVRNHYSDEERDVRGPVTIDLECL
jgi:hypothetical protein